MFVSSSASENSNLSINSIGKLPEESSVLVVGAGGIGCELLKSLALCRFGSIAVIDLDTIEVSNLNRQFLFRREHVGQPKASVACDSIRRICPSIHIEPFHGDVLTDPRFDMSFYQQYDLVINALDNVQARQHVNRMCLLCSKPLIDSGSTGYNGQATLIFKGRTQCYDCIEKPKQQRTYAVCTIRNTPSQPIHCIVWAKFLYNQLFGDNEDPNNEDVTPDSDDPENANNELENKTNGHHRVSTRDWIHKEMEEFDPKRIFNKLFFDDIIYLTSMKNLWEKRRQPIPMEYGKACLVKEKNQNGQGDHDESTMPKITDQRIQSISDYVQMFIDSVNDLKQRSDKQREIALTTKEPTFLVWDKNDDADLRFVTASANLRAYIFGINLTSKFDVKSMAGNIIPAVATTNAIVAGITVLQARKILATLSRLSHAPTLTSISHLTNVFISTDRKTGGIIQSIPLEEPNPSCIQCSDLEQPVRVRINMSLFTVSALYERVIRKHLKMNKPDVIIADGSGRILISADDDEDEQMMLKTLDQFKLMNGTILLCEEDCDDDTNEALTQNMKIKLMLEHTDTIKDIDDYIIVDGHVIGEIKQIKQSLKRKLPDADNDDDDDDDNIQHLDDYQNEINIVKKTKRLLTTPNEHNNNNNNNSDSIHMLR
ncbi:unnamed protein product [Rotaria socialis]|uniref:SUMO-activating enzyme subunit n=1 Tax=Rotaria socialis TaxID=392032 RepID=A0A818NJL1_9BILA|nr:unnamed protein product [Rotaria socialis]CAF4204161.1 unnamed protein product [Rotaria socialis]